MLLSRHYTQKISILKHVDIHTHAYTHTHTYTQTHAYTHTHTHTYTQTHANTHTYTHTYTHTHVHRYALKDLCESEREYIRELATINDLYDEHFVHDDMPKTLSDNIAHVFSVLHRVADFHSQLVDSVNS